MAQLTAFTRTNAGIFKIYDQGQDWQIVGEDFERWASVWANDRAASLARAVSLIPGLDESEVTYTNER
jgi:hypothetical protein